MMLSSLLQAGFGLALVLALVFGGAWAIRRLGLQPAAAGRALKVVASTGVGPRERVVVVEIGGNWLVLGVGSGQVRHLHTMAAEAAAAPATVALPAPDLATAFSRQLRESLGRWKRRA